MNDSMLNWALLKNAQILMTGMTGLFGSALLPRLLKKNEAHGLNLKILLVTQDPSTAKARLKCDSPALQFFSYSDSLPECTHLIHGSASSALPSTSEQAKNIYQHQIQWAERILDHIQKQHALPEILLLSSGAIYAPKTVLIPILETDPVIDDGPITPKNAYSLAKWAVESLFLGRLPSKVKIARCFTFAFDHGHPNSAYAFDSFLHQAVQKRPIIIQSDGSAIRSYLSADDLLDALFRILMLSSPHNIFNVGSNESLSIAQLGALFSKHFHIPMQVLGKTSLGNAPSFYVPNIDRIQTELGFKPRKNLNTILQELAQPPAQV